MVTRNEDEKYVAEMEQLELKTENQTAQGSITSSLAAAMQNAGVPSSIIGNFINIFAYTVDFRSDIKSGDTFKVLFDRKVAPDGKVVKNGDILYAELNLGRDKIALYRYEDLNGGVDYYNSKGIVRTAQEKYFRLFYLLLKILKINTPVPIRLNQRAFNYFSTPALCHIIKLGVNRCLDQHLISWLCKNLHYRR